MVDTGDDAPVFSAPVAYPDGDIEEEALSDLLEDGPVVLAFFPGAFTSVCTGEMVTFRDRLDAITDAGADLYGVSIDTPFALDEFADVNQLNFPLISDSNKELIDAYDVEMDFEGLGLAGVAKRSVFVVDESGAVSYAWVSDDPGVEPDYEEVEAAAADA
ncbi:redoxin domain-containing protein [Natronomonas amylolytica]|uniref:redoxin domain-containing protein n=1 Tax=Natronomonas amylolytica TaxID=3108498 RepID=UPI003008F6B6